MLSSVRCPIDLCSKFTFPATLPKPFAHYPLAQSFLVGTHLRATALEAKDLANKKQVMLARCKNLFTKFFFLFFRNARRATGIQNPEPRNSSKNTEKILLGPRIPLKNSKNTSIFEFFQRIFSRGFGVWGSEFL